MFNSAYQVTQIQHQQPEDGEIRLNNKMTEAQHLCHTFNKYFSTVVHQYLQKTSKLRIIVYLKYM